MLTEVARPLMVGLRDLSLTIQVGVYTGVCVCPGELATDRSEFGVNVGEFSVGFIATVNC